MQQRFKRFLERNFDVMVFGAALASVGPLMAWWSVLVRRNIISMDRLSRVHLMMMPDGDAEKAMGLAALDAHTRRQLFMISGETVIAGLLLTVLAVVLFAVARARRNENQRLQTMLQLTSHQLKTPIAGMRTLLQSLENGAIPLELQKQFLGRGVAECDRLEHLVETILAYQRAVARHAQLEAVNTEKLVGDILDHRRAMFPNEGMAWTTKAPATVMCDADAIHVVLENLLDNARKYGGASVELVEEQKSGRWSLSVKDHGQGFDPKDVERLFEPFERGGGTGVAHGSGLGLFIARQLMHRMGGDLAATSPGRGAGATFTLELPIASNTGVTQTEVAHG
jgi:signal transduction histidine kinase